MCALENMRVYAIPTLTGYVKRAFLSQPDSFLIYCSYKGENSCCCFPSPFLFQLYHVANAYSVSSVFPYYYLTIMGEAVEGKG